MRGPKAPLSPQAMHRPGSLPVRDSFSMWRMALSRSRLQEGDVGNFHDEAGGAVVRGVGDPVIDEKLLPHDTPEPAAFGQQGLEPAGQLASADVGIQVVRIVKADIYFHGLSD